jgi:hypothetical protein
MRQIVLQEENEKRYDRKHIDGYIREAIQDSPIMQLKITQGVQLVEAYKAKTYYASKNLRIAQLAEIDTLEMVTELFIGIAYFQRDELFTSVTAQMAGRLKLSDKTDAIKTVAEILSILCATDAFDIGKTDKMASLCLISRIPLSKELISFIENSAYLPPMVCEPLELLNNYSSGYLTHKDSLILGQNNHHDGDICLDVLNTLNKVQLRLDTQFLSTVEEIPTFDLDSQKKMDQWNQFKKQSYNFYSLMANQGNTFWLTNKVDKRGRIYASGYHITTKGTAFKKAMIELAHEELVEGVF